MSQVFTEETNIASAVESVLGTIPTTGARNHQPTAISKFGNQTKKMARDIISSLRQREPGRAVDADSGVDLEFDLTKDALDRDIEDIFKAAEKFSGNTGVGRFFPTAVTATGYTVPSGGALTTNHLVLARGFVNTANNSNGVPKVTTASIATEIKATGLVVEGAPPSNACVELCGWRGAVGDIGLDASGNLTSTVANFTTMGLFVGQWIWVGGPTGGTNAFATAAYRGWARIKAIAANLLTLEFRNWVVGSADNGATKLIDLYFGSFIRDVGSLHADYKTPSRSVEWTLPKLGAGSTTEWWYSRGNMNNTYTLNMSPGDKITVQGSWIGMVTDDPVTVQATGWSTPFVPTPGTFNMITTSADLARLRLQNVDETGLSTDFKSLTVKFSNNVSAEKELSVYGNARLNVGGFDLDFDAVLLLTDDGIIKAPRDNRNPAVNCAMRNDDGAAMLDAPWCDVEDAPPEAARNESVRMKVKIGARRHPTLNYTASMSRLPFCPAS
jgi:hypothetical protein